MTPRTVARAMARRLSPIVRAAPRSKMGSERTITVKSNWYAIP
jgi:hypothetical protein